MLRPVPPRPVPAGKVRALHRLQKFGLQFSQELVDPLRPVQPVARPCLPRFAYPDPHTAPERRARCLVGKVAAHLHGKRTAAPLSASP